MRVEGAKWNAYVAKSDTMEGAIWIGSIAMRFVEKNDRRKRAFLELMQEAVGEVIKELFRQTPTWNEPTKAPDHEKTRSD